MEQMITRYCSPTLAAMKAGSMFSYRYSDSSELWEAVRRVRSVLEERGVCLSILYLSSSRALIYVYRVDMLDDYLLFGDALRLLRSRSCVGITSREFICELRHRIRSSSIFPHEVGLFLGYPCEDVIGFIEKGASGYKSIGAWKVYGDVDEAKKRFIKYKKCTEIYLEWLHKGGVFDKLPVNKKEKSL